MAVVEGAVEGIRGVEVGVRAGRDDVAVIENDDRRGVADRGKTVRDDQDGFADDQLLERELDGGLAVAVEGAGGFVEDEDRGVPQESAGQGEALLLSAGEAGAAFADEGVVAGREAENEVVRVGGAGGGLDVGAGSLGAGDEEPRNFLVVGVLRRARAEHVRAALAAALVDAAPRRGAGTLVMRLCRMLPLRIGRSVRHAGRLLSQRCCGCLDRRRHLHVLASFVCCTI